MFQRTSAVFVLVLVIALSGCASSDRALVGEQAKIEAARDELLVVWRGFGYYQEENDLSTYPETSAVNSQSDLIRALSPYLALPSASETAWTFVSYERGALNDWFELIATAGDKKETLISVTPVTVKLIDP
ncbi:hypothetical protein ACFL3H_07640 [Gemmatimonadota bacterium]